MDETHNKPIWKQYALRNSMKRTVTVPREPVVDQPHECPCVIASKPCHPNCTCVNPVSSSGCYCCARYGSEAQRKDAADAIVKAMTNVAPN